MNDQVTKFGGVVLCGGRSTRMGYAKADLPFGGELMLQRVVRLLGEVVAPIVVVAAPAQRLPALPPQIRIANDPVQGEGPLAGLAEGLAALSGDVAAAYVTSCDVPLLAPRFVAALCGMLGESDVAVPREDRFYHPLAAVYRTSLAATVRRLLAAGERRPAALFKEAATRVVAADELKPHDEQLATLMNVNRPEDYLAALATAGLAPDEEVVAKLRLEQPVEPQNRRTRNRRTSK